MKSIYTQILVLFVATMGLTAQSDFYDISKVQEIKVSFEEENWPYLLDSLRYNGDELLNVVVRINGEVYEDAGIRYRSGNSFIPGGKRNGLFIDLGERNYKGRQIVDLSSALRDPSLVREVIAYEMAGRYFHAPRANFAKVYFGDDFYGLFVNIEPIDANFLKERFGDASGDLFYAKARNENSAPDGCIKESFGSLRMENSVDCYEHNFTKIQGADYTGLMSLAANLSGVGIGSVTLLDVDAALWMLAFNNLAVNLDSYSGQYASNYYLYKHNDRFVPIFGNMNLAFGSFKNTGSGSDLGTVEMLQLDPILHQSNEERPMISQLLSDESNMRQYISHMRTLLNEEFLSDRFRERVNGLQALIQPIIVTDANAYYSYEEFAKSTQETIGKRSKIPGLLAFMDKRTSWIKDQGAIAVYPPEITNIQVATRKKFSRDRMEEFRISANVNNYPKAVYLHYWLNGDMTEKVVQMYDDGQHKDGAAGDGVFGVVVAPKGSTSMKYYIQAENAKSMGYNPIRYRFEQHQTSLEEINR